MIRSRRRILWMIVQASLLLECYLHLQDCSLAAREVVKADAYTPVTTWSPPEGNTTFLDGTTWCVALSGASEADLQNALDWACGPGKADCGPIQAGGSCFLPDSLVPHASYAFNSYYQQNGNSDVACNFGGTAAITKKDPSYGRCQYAASGTSSAPSLPSPGRQHFCFILSNLLLLLYLGS